jgi:para-nitrobenzyl esterase
VPGLRRSFVSLLCLALLALAAPAAAGASPVVRTSEGKVRGERLEGVEAFRGIPYAAPPVGKRRFSPPARARRRHGVLDATGLTPPCPQLESSNGPTALDEDCLLLDVWRPRHTGRRTPVVFWIHGGGYENGSAGQHDPSQMVRDTHTIVVNINYRLGIFGWLALGSLDAEQHDVSGNVGFLDQQAALRWVHRNIRRFGGESRNVTVAGESAGGFAVCEHLTSPGSRGLFAHAIIESGWCPTRTHEEALQQGADTAAALGCPDPGTAANCLRGKDVLSLLHGWPSGDARPVVGGSAHPVDPIEAIDSGHFNRVPVVMGNTRDEFKFVKLANPDMTADELRQAVAGLYPDDVDAILAEYGDSYPTPADTFSAVINDPGICGIDDISRRLTHSTPVWRYEFNDQSPPPEVDSPPVDIGAYHSSELQYLFGFAKSDGSTKYQRGLDPAERRLSREMIRYWGNFAERGRPGGGWPRFTESNPLVLQFRPEGSRLIGDFSDEHRCGFWRGLGVPLEFDL